MEAALRVGCIGEGLLALHDRAGGGFDPGLGGDVLTTAIYLARLGVAVEFASALGQDRHSDWLAARWKAEGLGLDCVLRLPDRLPALQIGTDHWRGDCAARHLLALPGSEPVLRRLGQCDMIYLSGVTLSLLDAAGHAALAELARSVRGRGGRVAFDANFRPDCWPSIETARAAINSILPLVDIMVTGAVDEQLVFGDTHVGAGISRLRHAGVAEIAIKMGAGGAMISTPKGETAMLPARNGAPVDTEGAGDAFNAAYLEARLKGMPPQAAAERGNRLAGAVIRHRGAVIPAPAMPQAL